MEIKFNRKQVQNIIETYYREYEGLDMKAHISCKMEWVGYGMAEHEDAVVSISANGCCDVLGQTVEIAKKISSQDLTDIFGTVLAKSDYEVLDVTLDSGVKTSYEGYGMTECEVSKPYFGGVIVRTAEKKLVK